MSKEFDAVPGKNVIYEGLGMLAGQCISKYLHSTNIDSDEACEIGGQDFQRILDDIVNNPVFMKAVKQYVGAHNFNEEFFNDGLTR
jgi:hypothetical protein